MKSFPENILIINPGKNLFNPGSIEENSYLFFDGSYGQLEADRYFVSSLIPIDSNGLHINKLHTTEPEFICHIYYDSTGSPIAHTRDKEIPFIDNSFGVKFCFLDDKLSELQVEVGLIETPYEPYSEIGGYANGLAQKGGSEKTIQQLDDEKIGISLGLNLYDDSKKENIYIYYEDGHYGSASSSDYFTSDFIHINELGLYVNSKFTTEPSFVCHIYYDSLKQPIGNSREQILPYIADSFYVRICLLADKFNGLQVERGEVESKYQPYSEIGSYISDLLFDTEVILPDKINAIVGDTLQLFYRGMIKAVNPYNYNIIINCNKGQMYPRYFEYTPTSSDIGTTQFTLKLKSSIGKLLAVKTCELVTTAAVSAPHELKKVLIIGDSLTDHRTYPVELFRRLTQTGGSPIGLGYGNIEFVGRKKAIYGIGVEGNSG